MILIYRIDYLLNLKIREAFIAATLLQHLGTVEDAYRRPCSDGYASALINITPNYPILRISRIPAQLLVT